MIGRFLREAGAILLATVVGLGVLEAVLRIAYLVRNQAVDVVPLPYVIGHDFGPVPPWVDGLRILEPDRDLIWHARPKVHRRYIDVFSPVDQEADRTRLIRQFLPRVPRSLRANPVWEITLNRAGYRDRDFKAKAPGVFRVVCMGDSWTFGANVGPEECYPARLRALLAAEAPAGRFEVLNLGVLGYTSFQGRVLMTHTVLGLDPDLVVIGYGMNDGDVAGYRDKDMPAYSGMTPPLKKRVLAVAEKIEIVKLLKYAAVALTYHPKTMAEHIQAKAAAAPGAKTADEYAALAEWTRVSLDDYAANLTTMLDAAEGRRIPVVLMFNELWEASPYRDAIGRVAAERGVLLVDSSALLAGRRKEIEAELEGKLGLAGSAAGAGAALTSGAEAVADSTVEVLFRVFAGERPVPRALYLAGAGAELGNAKPNALAMHDDGTGGDERAGDRVWSYAARLPLGARVAYVYTNSGREGEWEGLDVPLVRQLTVGGTTGARLVRPIETFGEIPLQADPWHPNAAGYELIAAQVMRAMGQVPAVAERIQRTPAATARAHTRD